MTQTGLYVYALVPTDSITIYDVPTGIDDAKLHFVEAQGITAIVHESATEPYQGPDSDVQRWILQHSQVVDDAWQTAGTVLPMTFNVIVAPDPETNQTAYQRLEQWLADAAETVKSHLEQLRHHVELRVDISLDEEAVTAGHDDIVALRESLESRSPGVQRLYRKRLEERTRQVADRIADELYPQYRQRLAALADDMVENARLGKTPGSVTVLTASLLVQEERMEAVGIELADIRDHQPGVNIRYLGPWPPYSFSDVPELTGVEQAPQADH